MEDVLVIFVVDCDFPLLGRRVRVEFASLTAKNFDIRRYLMMVVLVDAVSLAWLRTGYTGGSESDNEDFSGAFRESTR